MIRIAAPSVSFGRRMRCDVAAEEDTEGGRDGVGDDAGARAGQDSQRGVRETSNVLSRRLGL